MSAADQTTGRGLGRRRLLRSGAVALAGAGAGWAGSAAARAADGAAPPAAADDVLTISPPDGAETVPYLGPHQAGVATPPQAHLVLLGLDLVDGTDTDDLRRLLRVVGDDAARLTQGEPALSDTEPELAPRPSRLTVTIGLGPRVVDELVPGDLTLAPLPSFSTDRFEEPWGQTDLALQLCADDPTTLAHARRMLLKDTASFATVRWVQTGFRSARGSQPDGTTMRNLMGQVDGTVNPAQADGDFADLVWADGPGAFAGGTVMVVRRIRSEMDTWDKVSRQGKELAVGRRLDTGAPLTGTAEHDEPDFDAVDDNGLKVIDAASHIARARSDDPAERFLRRGYNYQVHRDDGTDDAGLVFTVFCADAERQFVPVQRRLAQQDRLNEWITTIGSAVYAVPPGVASTDDAPGLALLEES
ncbi:MAG: peroxidase [Nocardioides sp.]|nr:peroxidase [Nocardioides sp.]